MITGFFQMQLLNLYEWFLRIQLDTIKFMEMRFSIWELLYTKSLDITEMKSLKCVIICAAIFLRRLES